MRKLLLAIILFCPTGVLAQGYRIDNVVLNSRGQPVPNPTVTVCTSTGTGIPCTPLATVYTGAALTTTAANPLPIVAGLLSGATGADAQGNYGFWVPPATTYIITVTSPQISSGYSYAVVAPPTASGNNTLTGANTETFKNLNSIRFADQFAGGDCGAKINAADADLGAIAGEIWVNQNCGLAWTTTVTLSTNHILRFIQPGTYISAQTVTLNRAAGLACMMSQGMSIGTDQPPCILQEANGANLARLVNAIGPYWILSNITLDGNKANNATALDVVQVQSNAGRGDVDHTNIQNGKRHGLAFLPSSNSSCCSKIHKGEFTTNGSDGIFSQNTNDVFVTASESTTNGAFGIELSDSGGWRIVQNDISASTNSGITIYGTLAGGGSSTTALVGNTFGNNFQNDILITGNDGIGNNTSLGNVIVGNKFIGSTNRTPANTYDNIKLVDGGNDVIAGNYIATSPAPNTSKCGIEQTETAANRALISQVGVNAPTGGFGTATYCDSTTNGVIGQQIPTRGGQNSSLDLFDITSGAANPHKYFRVSGGHLQLVNSAFGAVIFDIDNVGNITTFGNIGPVGNLTLPTSTDTLVGRATSDTLTNKSTSAGPLTGTVVSGTATMTTAAIAAGACSTTVTVAASGVVITDSIIFSFSGVPAAASGELPISSWPTAGNVNFQYCNPTAASVTPAAAALNWRVVR